MNKIFDVLVSFLGKVLKPLLSGAAELISVRVDFILMVIGKAFGPDGIRHFSELSAEEREKWLDNVYVLNLPHTDWSKPFNVVSRTSTTWIPGANYDPKIIAGNTDSQQPIPERGKWFATRGYLALTTLDGWHIRFGFRYDDVDQYINFPSFTIKKFD